MRNVEYTFVRFSLAFLVVGWQVVAPNGLFAARISQEGDRSKVGDSQAGSLLFYFGMAPDMQSKLMEPLMRKYVHGLASVYPCKNDANRLINLSTGVYPRLPQEVHNEHSETVFWERRC